MGMDANTDNVAEFVVPESRIADADQVIAFGVIGLKTNPRLAKDNPLDWVSNELKLMRSY